MKVTNANIDSTTDWPPKSFSLEREKKKKQFKRVFCTVGYFSTSKCSQSVFSAAGLEVALIVGDGDLAVHGFTLVHPGQRPGGRPRWLRLALGEGQVGGDAVPHAVAQHVVAVRVQQLSAAGGGRRGGGGDGGGGGMDGGRER